MNVWLLTNTPSPYQMEFLSAVASSGRCNLHVRFMGGSHRGEAPLASTQPVFESRVMRRFGMPGNRQEFGIHPEALRDVQNSRFDIFVLSGLYTSPTFLACAKRLTALHRPWLMWLEAPWPTGYNPRWARRLSLLSPILRNRRDTLLHRLLRAANTTFCIGTSAMRAYGSLGADPATLVNLPYHCNTERFQTKKDRDAVRRRLGIENKTVFLFSGSLIPRKGCDVLLTAFLRLAVDHPQAVLLFLGDGPMRANLERNIPNVLKSRVHFLGHCGQSDIPLYYQAADVFVFPSRHDGWGVVLNEAAAAGLPIVATESTGAALNLVEDGINGFRMPRDDSNALYDRMRHFVVNPNDIMTMGRESRRIIERFTLAQGVRIFCDTLENVFTHSQQAKVHV